MVYGDAVPKYLLTYAPYSDVVLPSRACSSTEHRVGKYLDVSFKCSSPPFSGRLDRSGRRWSKLGIGRLCGGIMGLEPFTTLATASSNDRLNERQDRPQERKLRRR